MEWVMKTDLASTGCLSEWGLNQCLFSGQCEICPIFFGPIKNEYV